MSEADNAAQTANADASQVAPGVTDAAASAAKPDAAKPAGTIAQNVDTGADKAVAAPADWPADWRIKAAGEDKSFLKTLDRFASPADMAKAFKAAQQRISSGELKKALGENPTPEELATWRKENGVPAEDKEYVAKLALPNGLVLGENDKPIADSFAKMAHGKNWTQNQFNDAIAWYYGNLDAQRAKLEEADGAYRAKAEDELRAEMGQEYRRNLTAVQNMMASWPEGLADQLLAARGTDGRLLGDNPALVRQLVSMARELNPIGSLVPVGTSDPAKSITARKTDLEVMMGKPDSEYWKGPKADALQAEYRDIVTALEKVSQRAA